MRIGINATSLNERPSGAKQRFIGLYGAVFEANPQTEYVIYEPRDARIADWFEHLPNVRGQITPLPSEGRWQRFVGGIGYWGKQLRRDRLDLFEALHLPLIRAPDCPTLLTVHDARPARKDVPRLRRRIYTEVLRRSLRSADHVVTVSCTMKAELLKIEPTARITTIYNGIDPRPFAIRSLAESRRPLPSDYLLSVGHFETRKNYAALLRAMTLIRSRHPNLGLIIVGNDGGTLEETRGLVDDLDLKSAVRLVGGLDNAALAALYSGAQALVFPSMYEGFGIPILEAMAAGCPLVLSDLPVFRELTEGRAMFFDPLEPASIAGSVCMLLGSTARREEQRAYGQRRIGAFGFPSLAAQLGDLHLQLIGRARESRDGAVDSFPASTATFSRLTAKRTAPSERAS